MPGQLCREMSASELLERYATGERNFAGICVYGGTRVDLCGATLSDANFCGSVLRGAMIGTDFTRSDLIGAELIQVNLRNAILHRTTLYRATLAQSILSGADLTLASLIYAELDNTVMENTNLCKASLIGSSGVDVESWLEQGCIFCHTTLPDGSKRNDGCKRLGIDVYDFEV